MKEEVQWHREIADLLVTKGNLLYSYPSCSYEIPKTLDKLAEYELLVTSDTFLTFVLFFLAKTMENIWSSVSSAASKVIPLKSQLDLIKMIGHHWVEIGEDVANRDKQRFLDSATTFVIDYLQSIRSMKRG